MVLQTPNVQDVLLCAGVYSLLARVSGFVASSFWRALSASKGTCFTNASRAGSRHTPIPPTDSCTVGYLSPVGGRRRRRIQLGWTDLIWDRRFNIYYNQTGGMCYMGQKDYN